jgi:signal peptidase I
MMGDNRDNSQDSRYIGFVPEGNIVGRAVRIWMNWDFPNSMPKWSRIGGKVA